MHSFQVSIEIDSPGAVLNMRGDLTHDCEKKLLDAYDKVASNRVKKILLNFSQVDYINSAGLSVLITMLTKSQNAGQKLIACGLSQHFQKIFDMVGLMKYIPHFSTIDEALQGF